MTNQNKDDERPQRVWITWDDAYPWPTPEMGGDEYVRADLVSPASAAPVVDTKGANHNDQNVTEWRKCFERRTSTVPYSDEHEILSEIKYAARIIELLYKEVQSLRAAAATAAPQRSDIRPSCWHCGVVLAYAPKLRCEDCPDECDVEGCDELGCAPATPTATPVEQSDDLVDEVQNRMDQVVEAAVEWHQAGREGGEWFEAAEKLGAAIDALLELRNEPQAKI